MKAIHVELPSKHSDPLDSGEGGSQCINELKRCINTVVNRGKFQDAGRDRPYLLELDSVSHQRIFEPSTLQQFNSKSSPQPTYLLFQIADVEHSLQ